MGLEAVAVPSWAVVGCGSALGGGQSPSIVPAQTPAVLGLDISCSVPLPLFLLSLPSFRLASVLVYTIHSHELVFLPSVSFVARLLYIFMTTFFPKSWSELSFCCS